MSLQEFLEMLGILIGLMTALKELFAFLVSLGPIITDCITHLWLQFCAASLGWLLTLWITFWGLDWYIGYSGSLLNRVASSMFRFLFSVAFWSASLAHLLQDYL